MGTQNLLLGYDKVNTSKATARTRKKTTEVQKLGGLKHENKLFQNCI